MLRHLGVWRVLLMTNNPTKIDGLESSGIEIVGRVPVTIPARPQNMRYLQAKQEKMGHLYPPPDDTVISCTGGAG
jgi:3,4-dihydroxy 2-butanone 4-phosphate synthase/GTP cyclohydrolase II